MEYLNIEKGIPFPPRSNLIYPYKDMEVGDSFKIKRTRATNAAQRANEWGSRQDPIRVFSQRKIDEEFSRVWRVELWKLTNT